MKILASLDGSVASAAILPVVEKLAKAAEAQVTLLTVAPVPAGVRRSGGGPEVVTPGGSFGAAGALNMRAEAVLQPAEPRWSESKDQAIERVEAEGRDALEDAARGLKAAGVAISEAVVINDDPAAAIVRFAGDGSFDLIVMATHGRSGLREVVQGSVAAAVMKSGVAPVLMVRPKK